LSEEQFKALTDAIRRLSESVALGRVIRPRLLSVEEAAAYLSISPKTIRNGLGPRAKEAFPVKPKRAAGKRVLFDIRDLDNYVDSLAD